MASGPRPWSRRRNRSAGVRAVRQGDHVGVLRAFAAAIGVSLLSCGPSPDRSAGTDTLLVAATAGTALSFDVAGDDGALVVDLLGQLWEVPAGGGRARLVSTVDVDADDRQPDVSPDGRWIATRSDRASGRGIWVHARDGSSARPLTDSATILGDDVGVPSWAPTGDRIAYVREGSVFLLDLRTGRQQRLEARGLESAALDEPDWSPDGRHLLVSGPWSGGSARPLLDGPEGASIWEIDLETLVARRVAGETVRARAPAYAPDGGRIAYFAAEAGGRFRLVIQAPGRMPLEVANEEGIEPGRVRWSRDGTSLLFVVRGRLRRASAAGGASTPVDFSAELRFPHDRYRRTTVRLLRPGVQAVATGFAGLALSPDGESIGMLALGRLWLVDPHGRVREAATVPASANGLTWSPDGTRVAWSAGPLAAQDVWVTDVRTGESRRVTDSGGFDSGAAWSPSGRWIAYVDRAWRVRLVDVSGSEPVESVGPEIPWPELAALSAMLQWTPRGDTLLLHGMDGWPVVGRGCARAMLVPLRGGPRAVDRFPCRPSHVTLAADGTLISVENGVLTERERVPEGWAEPHRVGDAAALHPSVSREGSLLFAAGDGLRLRRANGTMVRIGWPIRFRTPPAPPLMVRNARLVPIDARADTALMDVLTLDGRIVEIAAAGHLRRRVPRDTQELDAAGAWLMPGLVDTHTHVLNTGLAAPREALYHGVTTVRDMWGPLALTASFRDDLSAGVLAGARLLVSGPPFYPVPGPPAVTSDFLWMPFDSASAERGVEMLRAFGAAHVKLRYTQAWSPGRAFLRRAHAHGLPVGGHCAHALAFVSAGIDTHEHADGQCGDWAFGVGEDVGRLYRAAGVIVVPIIDVHDETARTLADPASLLGPEVLPFRAGLDPERSSDTSLIHRMERRAERARQATRVMREEGVRIALGSDAGAFPGGAPRELEALVAAGLTPREALIAATSTAAEVLGLGDEIGRVRPGFRADLVLLDANPLHDIHNVRRIRAVIQDGRPIDRSALLKPF